MLSDAKNIAIAVPASRMVVSRSGSITIRNSVRARGAPNLMIFLLNVSNSLILFFLASSSGLARRPARKTMRMGFINSAGCIGSEPIENHLFDPFTASPNTRTATRSTVVIRKRMGETFKITWYGIIYARNPSNPPRKSHMRC